LDKKTDFRNRFERFDTTSVKLKAEAPNASVAWGDSKSSSSLEESLSDLLELDFELLRRLLLESFNSLREDFDFLKDEEDFEFLRDEEDFELLRDDEDFELLRDDEDFELLADFLFSSSLISFRVTVKTSWDLSSKTVELFSNSKIASK